jgi:hypothetical protein
MITLDHPERTKACNRGELASRMVAVACDLACLVRDQDRDAIGAFLAALPPEEITALIVVQAAMIPVDDSPPADLLAWVRWDEYGQPLPGPVREIPVAPSRPGPRHLQPCGTYAAYNRHRARGELVDDSCREAAREYWRDRRPARTRRPRLVPAPVTRSQAAQNRAVLEDALTRGRRHAA